MMFNKKKCQECQGKLDSKFDFCPYCGTDVRNPSDKDEWGMLGKNDLPDQSLADNSLLGGLSGKMLNKMLSNAMKMLEKEMQKGSVEQPRSNFELFINGKKVSPENIKFSKKTVPKKQIVGSFSLENSKKFSELPKAEPNTNIRRLSNKVVYEIDVPGVENVEDILINQLENSLEIKAVGKDKAYKKLIPIDLPLKRYKLFKDKLILELGVKE